MRKILFLLLMTFCLAPFISSAVALLLGIGLAMSIGNPFPDHTRKLTPRLLGYSVIGLGAGMNLVQVAQVGAQGFGYTALSISLTLALGLWIGKLLGLERNISMLVSGGTAICGGSAIAALAPTLRAKSSETSVALATVFLLNSAALILFPWVGHHFSLTESQFGLWAALAIHDTSSVVGACLQYGSHALEIGTTIKLARALWIVPLTAVVGAWVLRSEKSKEGSLQTEKAPPAKKPWFILGFVLVAAIVTWIPGIEKPAHAVEFAAKRLLVLTLFLIGSNLNRTSLKQMGVRPFLQGVMLWFVVASVSLYFIRFA